MKIEGPHTGDISAEMLKDAGATHVILGHSERRTDHGETNATVLAKATMAITVGLRPIVCVGETLAEREKGLATAIVQDQVFSSIPHELGEAGGIVAYEPVWAIGTGKTASEAEIAEMHAYIRSLLGNRAMATVPILYGGSVKPANAQAILGLPEVGGALVGGASLVAADFLAIAAAAP
jgi:triosephosphate isomerase